MTDTTTRQPWHKESALGWLERASKARCQRSPGNPEEIALTPEDKIMAAVVHALLYVGDMVAEGNVPLATEALPERESGGFSESIRSLFAENLKREQGYKRGEKIKLTGFGDDRDGEWIIEDLRDNDLLLRPA